LVRLDERIEIGFIAEPVVDLKMIGRGRSQDGVARGQAELPEARSDPHRRHDLNDHRAAGCN
jgi:hypothetical protein